MEKSKGHRAFIGGFEYFITPQGELVRAPLHCYITQAGYRIGARFVAPKWMIAEALTQAREDFHA